MLEFKELRITSDGKCLIIDVNIKDEIYYEDMTISNVTIDNQNTFSSNGGNTPIFDLNLHESIAKAVYRTDKRVLLYLDSKSLVKGSLNDLLFVRVDVSGEPAPNTPCGCDNAHTVAAVVNMYPIYKAIMRYIKEFNESCTIPKNFIDSVLKLKTLLLYIKLGNYEKAIWLWNKFKSEPMITKCNCYG